MNISYKKEVERSTLFQKSFFKLLFLQLLQSHQQLQTLQRQPQVCLIEGNIYVLYYSGAVFITYFRKRYWSFLNSSSPVCENKKPNKRCHRMKNRCNRVRVRQQCPSTCDACCENLWSDPKCRKRKGLCKQTKVKRNCRNTCECMAI